MFWDYHRVMDGDKDIGCIGCGVFLDTGVMGGMGGRGGGRGIVCVGHGWIGWHVSSLL